MKIYFSCWKKNLWLNLNSCLVIWIFLLCYSVRVNRYTEICSYIFCLLFIDFIYYMKDLNYIYMIGMLCWKRRGGHLEDMCFFTFLLLQLHLIHTTLHYRFNIVILNIVLPRHYASNKYFVLAGVSLTYTLTYMYIFATIILIMYQKDSIKNVRVLTELRKNLSQ